MSGRARHEGAVGARAQHSRVAKRFTLPLQGFIRSQATTGVVLLVSSAAALLVANSPWAPAYHRLLGRELGVDFGFLILREPLHLWINDAVMTTFFFLVGLEIKQELVAGELADLRRAALPVAAAVGGMAVPAGLFAALNWGRPSAAGWGVPMATDIAFAVGILVLLGKHAPPRLRVFLLAMATVDDIGAIAVIAVFYTSALNWIALAVAGGVLAVILAVRRAGVQAIGVYAALGTALWVALFESGVHATIAGVLLGLLAPARPLREAIGFAEAAGDEIEAHLRPALERGDEDDARRALGRVEIFAAETEAPSERLERRVRPWVNFVVLPLFAFANAGIAVDLAGFAAALGHPAGYGTALGLVAGKPVGVVAAAALVVKTGLAKLPEGVGFRHLAGVGLLAGIGFTVSLFITQLAFPAPATQRLVKLAILGASAVSAVLGTGVLYAACRLGGRR